MIAKPIPDISEQSRHKSPQHSRVTDAARKPCVPEAEVQAWAASFILCGRGPGHKSAADVESVVDRQQHLDLGYALFIQPVLQPRVDAHAVIGSRHGIVHHRLEQTPVFGGGEQFEKTPKILVTQTVGLQRRAEGGITLWGSPGASSAYGGVRLGDPDLRVAEGNQRGRRVCRCSRLPRARS